MLRTFLLLFVLSLPSCAWVGSYIDKIKSQEEKSVLVEVNNTYKTCEVKPESLSIYASDMEDTISSFLKLCMNDAQANVEQKTKRCFLNLALYQMFLSPDKISPFSKTFFIIQNKNNISIFDGAKNKNSNYWLTLWGLAKEWGQYEWFTSQISSWIKNPKIPIKVSKRLEVAIRESKILYKDTDLEDSFRQHYLRGDELISAGEDLPYQSVLSLLSSNKIRQNAKVILEKFDNYEVLNKKNNYRYSCNFNLDLVMEGKVFPYQSVIQSSLFSVKYGNWLISMAAFGKGAGFITDNKVISYFMQKSSSVNLAPTNYSEENSQEMGPQYCYVQQDEGAQMKSVLLSSFEGRDPGQYIASTMNYIMGTSINLENLSKIMISPRHLLLLNPLRVGFEVEKANEEQTQNILNLGVPIFNEKYLGLMQMNGSMGNSIFYIPDRRGTQDYCSYTSATKGKSK